MKITLRELIVFAYLAVIMMVGKKVLAFLPNIEIVTTLTIIFSLIYRYKSLYISIIFVLILGFIDGFAIWWLIYLITWPTIVIISVLLRKILLKNHIGLSIYCGLCGFFFSIFFILQNLVLYGPYTTFTYFLSGIPYDTIHMIGNFFIMLFLGKPIYALIIRLNKQFLNY
ncbi:hypothetical protein [Clostridium mediterraneense]|uniref:hypothetical protein n=1 Tax=Clostridium mediterraneense TaxID=1805472 RepID=UPI00083142C3|nr:hypothetical protein [Clostridium mediterraneense]